MLRGKMRPRWLRLLVFGVFMCGSPVAAAESARARVVVLVDSEQTPLTRRLQQEVEALGFVVRIEPDEGPEAWANKLSEDEVVASIEVRPTRPGRLSLVILDPKTHELVRAELALEARRDPAAAELVATRTAELLRAVRLSVPTRTPPAEPVPAPTPHAAPSTRSASARPQEPHAVSFVASAGPALLLVPDWSAAVAAGVDVALMTKLGFGVSARALTTLTPARIQNSSGSIEATYSSYRLGALFEWRLTRPLRVRVGAGGELDRSVFRGVVAAPWVGQEDRSTAFGIWGATSLSVHVATHLALTSGFSGSWETRRTAVRYAGQVVRDWGRPILLASLGLEWASQ